MKDNSLIIIPTYNEAENIGAVINKIFSFDDNNSILVVEDNSPDGTSNIVDNLKKDNADKLFLITRDKKDGQKERERESESSQVILNNSCEKFRRASPTHNQRHACDRQPTTNDVEGK